MDTPILFVEFPQYGPENLRVMVNVHHVIAILEKNNHVHLRTTHADIDLGCTYEEAMVALGMAGQQ